MFILPAKLLVFVLVSGGAESICVCVNTKCGKKVFMQPKIISNQIDLLYKYI